MYTSKPGMLPTPWPTSGMNEPHVHTHCWGLYLRVLFSKPDISKLDKVLSKLTQEICNNPRNATNILTHLYTEDFGISIASLLLDYVHCIGKQLITTLDDLGQLGTIKFSICVRLIVLRQDYIRFKKCLFCAKKLDIIPSSIVNTNGRTCSTN